MGDNIEFLDLDWGVITAGDPIPDTIKDVKWVNIGTGVVSNLTLSMVSDDTNAIFDPANDTVTFNVISDLISTDNALIQNSYFPQFNGDVSGQIQTVGAGEILSKYKDTVLYCISAETGKPYEKNVMTTMTANYTYTVTVVADPIAVPPVLGSVVVTQETCDGIYAVIERKNLSDAEPTLKLIVEQTIINQKKYKDNGLIPL